MKRGAFLTALAALLVAAAAWSLLRRTPRPESRAATPPPAASSEAPAAALERGPSARDELAPGARTSADPVVVAPEPAPAPSASAEALRAELAALQVEVPFGTLEVLVLEIDRPLAGARVLVHGTLQGGSPRELDALLEHGFEGQTDADGLVRFGGLGADTYEVRVLAPPRPVLQAVVVHALNRHRRVLAVYGSGSLSGHVYDRAGVPVEGCLVSVESYGELMEGQTSKVRARTNAGGEYRIEGLLAEGTAWVTRECGDLEPETVSVALAPGQDARVDFGWPGGLPLWTGAVRDLHGTPVEFPGRLTVRRLDNQEQSHLAYGADGRFEALLRPGTYAVGAWGFEGAFVLGEVDVPAAGLERDLELPFARVEVELTYSGDDPDPQRVLSAVQVWLRETPERGGRLADGAVGPRRSFRAVPPGSYYLVTRPSPLIGMTAQPVTVRPGAAVERIQATVGDP